MAGDIRDRAGAEQIVAATLERFGRLDLVLNNAGGQYMVPAESLATKGWRAVQRLNVDGTLAMCKAAYELAMREAGAGTIVNVTVSPHHGMPAMAHTGAARAAVEAITRELAAAYGLQGIAVIAVALGRFDTESLRKYPAELWRTAAATVPLQRLGTLEEYGWLIACSPRRSGARSPARSSRSTARSTTGSVHGLLHDLTRDGQVPTEAATTRRLTAARGYHSDTRGRGVNGCTGAFQALGTGSTPVARSKLRVESTDHGE